MHFSRVHLALVGLVLALATACQSAVSPSSEASPPPRRPAAAVVGSPSARPARAAASPVPSPSPSGGLALGTPLTGEFAVTANMDDRSLSVVPIGLARALPPVQVDVAPASVGTWSNTSRVVAADGSPGAHAVSSLDLANPQATGDLDVGGVVHVFSANGQGAGPLVLVSNADDSLRTLDPTSGALGAPVALGPGPHAVAFAGPSPTSPAQIFVANAADGSVSVLDGAGTTVQSTLNVGGQPVGIAVTPRNRLWIADGSANDVYQFDPSTGRGGPPIEVGAGLKGLAATADAHYLVLASSDPDHALYSVDLYKTEIGQGASAVNSLAVPGGVLAVATGAEITLAYATTGDNQLVYWDLVNNAITRSVAVGRNPVGLSLGLVMPNNLIPPVAQVGGGGGTTGSAGAGGSGGTSPSSGNASPANTSTGNAAASTSSSSTGAASTGPSSSTGPASSGPSSATGSSATSPSSNSPASTGPSSTGPSSTSPSTSSSASTGASSIAGSSTGPASTGPSQPATTTGGTGGTNASNTSGSTAPSIASISSIGNSSSGGGAANNSAVGGSVGGTTGASGGATGVGGTSAGASTTGGAGTTSASAGGTTGGANGLSSGTGGAGAASAANTSPIGGTTSSANTPNGGARATATTTPRTAPATPTPSRAAAATPGPSPAVGPRG